MKRLLPVVIGTMLSTLASAAPSWDAKNVVDCMRSNVVKRGALRQLEVVTSDREGGKETLDLNIYWSPSAGGTRINMQVTKPDSLAGSAYLLREAKKGADELYVYVPAIGKVRSISGTARGEKLWGTNFSYEEFKLIQGMALADPMKKLADAKVMGRPVFVLESNFTRAQKAFSKVVTYVDQQSCTVLRGELFNHAGRLSKVLEGDLSLLFQTSDYSEKPIWLLLGYSMKDVENGTESVVSLGQIQLMEKARASLFDPKTFFQVAPASE